MIAAYLAEMGVDARVLTIAIRAGPDDLITLTPQELVALRITTPAGFSEWRTAPYRNGLVAMTQALDSRSYVRQLALYCYATDGRMLAVITLDAADYDPGGRV